MRRKRYIHELSDWPKFHWDQENLANSLASVRHRQGRLVGHMEALGFELQQQAELTALTDEVVKSSEIEGEKLDTNEVRSSIARRLGIDVGGLEPTDRHVEGVVEMMLDATRKYEQPLTADRLFGWHSALFPTGRSGMRKIRVGAWRDDSSGPMQVVSGPVGRERVHFEAPAAERLDQEMDRFLAWFNEKEATKAQIEPVLKAGVAHLWFVTIHPFDDGNGRIARAIAVEPDVILMDEPCSALDPIATARIEDLMQELKRDYTIVIVTHNMQQAARVADFTAFMLMDTDERYGQLIEFAPTTDLFNKPTDPRTEGYITGRFG